MARSSQHGQGSWFRQGAVGAARRKDLIGPPYHPLTFWHGTGCTPRANFQAEIFFNFNSGGTAFVLPPVVVYTHEV